MKRRGFLGFLGGAAVAGPSMVKNAAASMADLHLPGIATSVGVGMNSPISTVSPYEDIDHQKQRFARWSLARLNPDWVRRKKQERWVDGLDPDLASYRSLSLSTKVRMQRERNFERWLDNQGSWFDRYFSGETEHDEF